MVEEILLKKNLLYVESTKDRARKKFNYLAMLADQDRTLLILHPDDLTIETSNVKIRVTYLDNGEMLKGCRFDSVIIDESTKLTTEAAAWLAPIVAAR